MTLNELKNRIEDLIKENGGEIEVLFSDAENQTYDPVRSEDIDLKVEFVSLDHEKRYQPSDPHGGFEKSFVLLSSEWS